MLMGTVEHLFIHWHMQGMPTREKSMMDMLDTFLEIILNGIRAKKEQQGLTLHLNLEDARALGQLLQTDPTLKLPKNGTKALRTTKNRKKAINNKQVA